MIVTGPEVDRAAEILTPSALEFIATLHEQYAGRRADLLEQRRARRDEVSRTKTMDFPAETASVRSGTWQVAAAPADLVDRRVEMTGPTERKMMINALNSGAKVWLADMEDANTPHWRNVIEGQLNLTDSLHDRLAYRSPDGRDYTVTMDRPLPTVVVRPRGWHLDERHLQLDGRPAVGALVDFGLHFFHNATALLEAGSGPYYYLPKMESYLEARLWNDVFTTAQAELGVPHGSVRATVLIETIPAAFQMAEILYELRDHASGLNAGRWDYLFSIIKYFRDAGPEFVLPDRVSVTMTSPPMRAYTELLVRTCHEHGAYAIGGMAAFIPSRRDPEINAAAIAKVRDDKRRESRDGFDGSWVAHPDLVPICAEEFDAVLGEAPNQLHRLRQEVTTDAPALLNVAAIEGQVTSGGLRTNVSVAVRYIAAWLDGNGAVAIDNLMEDAATAEISRSQIWQWIHNGVTLADTGQLVTPELVKALVDEVDVNGPRADAARELFTRVALDDEFVEFLTLPASALID